jgi:hypothetical protein
MDILFHLSDQQAIQFQNKLHYESVASPSCFAAAERCFNTSGSIRAVTDRLGNMSVRSDAMTTHFAAEANLSTGFLCLVKATYH